MPRLTLLNVLDSPAEIGHDEYALIRRHLQRMLRTSQRPAAALEQLIASCDQFMCWAEHAKSALMDLRPARKRRSSRSVRRSEPPALRLRARISG